MPHTSMFRELTCSCKHRNATKLLLKTAVVSRQQPPAAQAPAPAGRQWEWCSWGDVTNGGQQRSSLM